MTDRKIYEFDTFRLDADHAMLYREQAEVPLPPKAVETLIAMVERRGEIISKDELMSMIWRDSIVEESNLALYLHVLRKTLGERADRKPYIETLRRRGYRFAAEVRVVSADAVLPEIFGRQKEIEDVEEILNRDSRLLTLTGVGGVGKTTLARAIVERFRRKVSEVFFVELASIDRPELIPSVIAGSMGLKAEGERSPLEELKAWLRDREVLLVLDNFEHLISGVHQITEMLSDAARLKILVTSRVRLRLSIGREYVVPPLPVPKGNHSDDPMGYAAVELFARRAQDADPEFALTGENAWDVASICKRLDGLPLAIELAAARIPLMSPAAIAQRLGQKLRLLTGGPRDMPARQQTMRGAIAWSYDLLGEDEKSLFSALSVFAGSFTIEAAESVCGCGPKGPDVLEGITSLVQQNLLDSKGRSNREPRFQMLEVVREYAAEVLAIDNGAEPAQRRHAEYYLTLAESAEPHLQAARSSEWLERLEAEHDNLRAALTWSLREDPEMGQRSAGAVWKFWWLHGHIREGCVQLDAFLSQPCDDPETRAKMLAGAAALNRLRKNFELSRMYAEEAASLARDSGDHRNGALSLHQLGFLALDDNDFDEAERVFSDGLALAEKLGDKQVIALLYNGKGELARLQNDLDHAAEFYSQALRFNTEAGDRVRQTTALINLGATAVLRNDTAAAGDHYRRGLKIASEMADMNGTLYCLEGLAGTFWSINDPATAAKLYGAAERSRTANNLPLEAADRLPYERSLARVRDALGPGSFEAYFAEGGSIDLEEAIPVALSIPS